MQALLKEPSSGTSVSDVSKIPIASGFQPRRTLFPESSLDVLRLGLSSHPFPFPCS
jgi:hypothetical protein